MAPNGYSFARTGSAVEGPSWNYLLWCFSMLLIPSNVGCADLFVHAWYHCNGALAGKSVKSPINRYIL